MMDIREYRSHAGDTRHPWEQARFKVVHRLIKKHLAGSRFILDVGCGDGYVSGCLASLYNINSLIALDNELDSSLIEQFKTQNAVENIQFCKTMDDVDKGVGDRKVSVVLLLDVLEHIEFEKDFFDDILNRSWLADDAVFLVTVPAFQFLFGSHDRFLGHFRRYSGRRIQEVLRSAGMEIIDSGYFFSILLPVRLLQVWKEKIFGTKGDMESKLVAWRGGKTKTMIIKHVLYFDFVVSRFFLLFGIKLPGLSNYVLCKKSAS